MPVGIIINALSVAIGGVVGALFGHKLPTRINSELTKIFGVCSMGMGVSSIGLMKNMPAVIFAVIIGTAFGLAVNLGGIINSGAACMEKPVGKIFPNKNASMSREEYMTMLVTIIVLFCASGTGIYGSLDSGMSGDHTILISKSILDFFTAMIFGGTLGMVVAAVAIPQCVIFLAIFAAFLAPSDLRRSRHLLVLRPAGGGVHGDERHRKPLNSFTRHKPRLFPRKSGAVRRPHRTYELPHPKSRSYD